MADPDLEHEDKPAEPMPAAEAMPEPSSDPMPTHERLRAFEDKIFGEHVPRVNGHVERGIGSPHSRMKPHHKAHHDALVELMAAETAHVEASRAEDAAHKRLEAAIKRAAETEV